jgi:hypothetical protein
MLGGTQVNGSATTMPGISTKPPGLSSRQDSKIRVIDDVIFNSFCKKWPLYYCRDYDIIRVYIGETLTEGHFAEACRETLIPVTLETGDCLLDYQRDEELRKRIKEHFRDGIL